jgi:predicted GNAT family acetyltransferase
VVDNSDRLVTVALRTPPQPLLLTDAPADAVDALVSHLLATHPDLPGVGGPADAAARFADRWQVATGRTATVTMRQRLFRLDSVTPPAGVAGAARPAAARDRDRLVAWLAAFHREAAPRELHPDPVAVIDRGLRRPGAWWLWEVAGEPVSMLTITPRVAGVTRISAVFTPPDQHGHGYACACVAAASQWALDQGADACMLYTDLANATSNKIYQAVGYRPVGDATRWRLA